MNGQRLPDQPVDAASADGGPKWPTIPSGPMPQPRTAERTPRPILFSSSQPRLTYITATLLPFVVACLAAPLYPNPVLFLLSLVACASLAWNLVPRTTVDLQADAKSLRQLDPEGWTVDWDQIRSIEILPGEGGLIPRGQPPRVLVREGGHAELSKGRSPGWVSSTIPLAKVDRFVALATERGVQLSISDDLGRPGAPALDAPPQQPAP